MSEQRRIDTHEIFVGALVSWLHVPRGGYSYTRRVPARIVAVTPKRVLIEAELARGGVRRVYVTPERLEPRA